VKGLERGLLASDGRQVLDGELYCLPRLVRNAVIIIEFFLGAQGDLISLGVMVSDRDILDRYPAKCFNPGG